VEVGHIGAASASLQELDWHSTLVEVNALGHDLPLQQWQVAVVVLQRHREL
jgi:hypothetical protein